MDYFALSLFAIGSSITPGPNNMMTLASGVNYGFRRSMPRLLGISLGFCIMIVAVWLGLGTGLKRYLDQPAYLKAFNYLMAALLVASLYPIAFELKAWLS